MMCYVIDWGREGVEGACIFAASGSDVADSVIILRPVRADSRPRSAKDKKKPIPNCQQQGQYRTRPKYLYEFVTAVPNSSYVLMRVRYWNTD